MINNRMDRQERFFGQEGQRKIRNSKVAIVGVGGLGSIVCQQLAYLGVGDIFLIDDEELEKTNLNRYVTARDSDSIPGTRKVDIGERMIGEIDPSINVCKEDGSFPTKLSIKKLAGVTHVFGCLDNDGARQVLMELCCQFEIPYLDLATDINSPTDWGGRVMVSYDNQGCLHCFDELDPEEIRANFESPDERKTREAIYGVSKDALDEVGPSVITINGVVASLAVTEFICLITDLRVPKRMLLYRGNWGIVSDRSDGRTNDECYYCNSTWGNRDMSTLTRYLVERLV